MLNRTVSIVVPCYNAKRFLGESLRSALDQTRAAIEVMVVDDGSTDESIEALSGFPGVRCVRQENQGVSVARNRGLSETQGEYVIFQDADDRLLPDAAEVGARALGDHPECAFVYGFSRMIDAQGRVREGVVHGQPADGLHRVDNASYATLLAGNGVVPSGAAMFRRSALEAVGGYQTGLRRAQDHELYLRLARRFPIFCHNQIVVEYRNHEGNTTHSSVAAMLKSVYEIVDAQGDWIGGKPHLEAAALAGKAHWAKILGSSLAGEMVGSAKRGKLRQSLLAARMLAAYYPVGMLQWLVSQLWDSSSVGGLSDESVARLTTRRG